MLLKSAFVLTVLASVVLAQVPPHHKINGFVPPKLYGKQQLKNEEMPRGFEHKPKQVTILFSKIFLSTMEAT
jgi:hypothetical protein